MSPLLTGAGRMLRRGCGAVVVFLFSTLLSAHGRIGRLQLAAITFLAWWPVVLGSILVKWLKPPDMLEFLGMAIAFLYVLFALVGAAARRLHDLGYSGGWAILAKPFWFLLLSLPGQSRENAYGPVPEERRTWLLGLLFVPALVGGEWLYHYVFPTNQTLVIHRHTEENIGWYWVNDAWGGDQDSRCCVRIKGDRLLVKWRTLRSPDQYTEEAVGPVLEPTWVDEKTLDFKEVWRTRTIRSDEYELELANPPRGRDDTFLHVHFLPERQIRLAWSRDEHSPLAAELAASLAMAGAEE